MAETSRKSELKKPKNPVQRISGHSYSPQEELLELLKSKCPEVFTEGKIDGGKLKQTLGEELETNNERYGLTWAGKSECFHHIQETTTATLKPIRAESVDFDTTENIFIEGDNLEVLKILQKTYQNKIKMIYIDPPYNTGNDSFIYPDRFKEEKEDYEQRAGIKDAEGLLTKDGFWRKNSKDAGHFHSNWLSMMYPRLFLAKNLLRDDGVIFVSIDDNEVHNLRMIMDEVFGEENFLAQLVWKNKTGAGAKTKGFITLHEYILCYFRDANAAIDIEIPYSEKTQAMYNKKDEYFKTRGPYATWPLDTTSMGERKNLRFPITYEGVEIWPEKQWLWSKERVLEAQKKNMLVFNKQTDGTIKVRFKGYLYDEDGVIRKGKPLSIFEGPYTQEGSGDFEGFFDKSVFPFPKPVRLIKQIINCSLAGDDNKNDIVLDFFAGSGTTAHAVMALNTEDGGNRKFICVQMAEPCDEESEAFKAGFKTIADIGKERIRRAAKKIKKDREGNLKFDKNRLDLGFKIFRLEQSNFKQWRENVKTGEELKEQMKMFVDNITKGAKPDDMLFEIILKNSRFDLNIKVEKKSFGGVDYYRLATEGTDILATEHTELTENVKKTKSNSANEIICLDSKITKKFVDKVLVEKPERFTCLDVAFKNNDQLKTNTALQMEAAKIDFKVI